ncbi:hypothetical protein F2P81_017041 [Scophthalmus maximus]|uniref:Uncharacterized protein n=1 Tax=Scophthalmus maximus TaxID=52904 RepID=A0A6A4SER7_SCOMX|nr:hypothetical protein F2P81_017041 [Scophthalmus maximus]
MFVYVRSRVSRAPSTGGDVPAAAFTDHGKVGTVASLPPELQNNAQSYERPRTQHATDKTQLHERCFDRTLTSVIAATAVVVHTSATNEQTGPACGIHEYMTHFTR